MEHKRDIQEAGLSDEEGNDLKRICLPPLDGFGEDFTESQDEAVLSADYAWMQTSHEFMPSTFDDVTFEDQMYLDHLPEYDEDSGHVFTPSIDLEQPGGRSVTTDITTPLRPETSSPAPFIKDELFEEDHGEANGIDTCFGAITAKVVSSFADDQKRQVVPVNIELHGDLVKIYTRHMKKYAGILIEPTLVALLRDTKIKVEASLILPQPVQVKRLKSAPGKKATPSPGTEPEIRILIYGMLEDAIKVGKTLSDGGLYLQHPTPTDHSLQLRYHNPQFLVRPGREMPTLDDLSITASASQDSPEQQLDEVAKSRVLRVFDDAHDGVSGSRPTIEPSPRLRTALKEHQRSALSFMSEKESPVLEEPGARSLWRTSTDFEGKPTYRHIITGAADPDPRPALGGILADDMGLGKTLSLLSLICWSCDNARIDETPKRKKVALTTLIITPMSTISGWGDQIRQHILPGQIKLSTFHGNKRRLPAGDCDIILTTYETLRSDWDKKKLLYSKAWLRVVLDEAHRIGNRSSQVFQAACNLQASRRWCLTGTPIKNSLDNYGALLSFLQIQPFTHKSQFDKWIRKPMEAKNAHSLSILRDLVYATCLRRTKKMALQSVKLPNLTETTQDVVVSGTDRELYTFFEKYTAAIASKTHDPLIQAPPDLGRNILSLMNSLRRICDHGLDMLPADAVGTWNTWKEKVGIEWDMLKPTRRSCDSCQSSISEDLDDTERCSELRCGHTIGSCCSPQNDGDVYDDDGRATCPICIAPKVNSKSARGDQDQYALSTVFRPSSKLAALLHNIREEQQHNNASPSDPVKSVVFSSWTKMLDLVQTALEKGGYRCVRIDGTKSLQERRVAIESLNQDKTVTVMLASISSAGEGVNLTAASRVHLVEPHWNPMAEAQAIHRVHRIGQLRPVRATRYIVANSVETYIQWVQQQKLQLISQSLDSGSYTQKRIEEDRWNVVKKCLCLDA